MSQSRRSFIQTAFWTPVAFSLGFSRLLRAAAPAAAAAKKKTVTTTEAVAKAGIVDVKRADTPQTRQADTMAKALRYVHKTDKPDQKCDNCMQFSWAVDASGKEITVDIKGGGKQKVGSCQLFETGKGFVAAEGYCMSWFKTPA